jgi:dTDP-4-amino-4,6-dideoxygalactose transaminase
MTTTDISALALFGAEPAFARPLHVGRPNLGDRARFLERVEDILDRRWLTNSGPYEREFEARVAERVGVRECVATCNGTVALELVTRALGMTGEVIVPSFTFVATAHCLEWQGARPVFADVDRETHTLDPASVERAITPRTTGILGVHVWGQPCDVEALTEIADRHGLALAFDASHAFGCTHHRKAIGGFGRAEVFSFHATKVVNAGEGGAICTDDVDLAKKLRLMRNFGFRGKDDGAYLGSNGKMPEMSAALGITSLESMDEFCATNERNYGWYRAALARLPGLRLFPRPEGETHNHHYVVVEILDAAPLTRDELVDVLGWDNVLARRYFSPGVHRMVPYAEREHPVDLGGTEELSRCVMTLPTGQEVNEAAVQRIVGIMETALSDADAVRERLREVGSPSRPVAKSERARV